MKKHWRLLLLAGLLLGCEKPIDLARERGEYACPMLCVIDDYLGECPICGMQMARVSQTIAAESSSMELDPESRRRIAIRTQPTIEAHPTFQILLSGEVIPAESRTTTISAWVNGRIETLNVNQTGIFVEKDAPLATLYSPALISAQQELILAVEQNDLSRIRILQEKLAQLGVGTKQIEHIKKQTTPQTALAIGAPTGGIVLQKNVFEGDRIQRGMPLFRLNDLSEIWIELQADETDLLQIRRGQSIEIIPTKQRATIDFVAPVLDPQTRTASVRATLANPDRLLRPGMLIRAIVRVRSPHSSLLIPATAPLFTGKRARVYVEIAEGVFEGRDVQLGRRTENLIEVRQGIELGERVVVQGAFQLDAAMQISGRTSMISPATIPPETPLKK